MSSTFGNTSTGTSPLDNPSNNAIWIKATTTPASNGTLDSIFVYCKIKFFTPNVCAGLFSDSSGSPNTDLGHNYTGVAAPSSIGWVEIPISGSVAITSGTQYHFGLFIPGGGSFADIDVYYTDPGAVNDLHYKDNGTPGGSTFPTTSGMTAVQHENWAMYASYTASGSSGGGQLFFGGGIIKGTLIRGGRLIGG